jgi:hypothetical protein
LKPPDKSRELLTWPSIAEPLLMPRAFDSCQDDHDLLPASRAHPALLRCNNMALKSEDCGTDQSFLRLASSAVRALCSVIVRIKQLVTLIDASVQSTRFNS